MIWLKTVLRTYILNVHTCVIIGASRSGLLLAVHNRKFPNGRTHAHTACQRNTVQLRTNGVKSTKPKSILYIFIIDLAERKFFRKCYITTTLNHHWLASGLIIISKQKVRLAIEVESCYLRSICLRFFCSDETADLKWHHLLETTFHSDISKWVCNIILLISYFPTVGRLKSNLIF